VADIFLSYSRENQAIARRFAENFEQEGLKVWWDATLKSGQAYDRVTETALREAKAVVVLWSQRSVNSDWVRAEATIALRNKTLMPVMIEDCVRPVMFELTQTADLTHWSGSANDPAWQHFIAELRHQLTHGPDTAMHKPANVALAAKVGSSHKTLRNNMLWIGGIALAVIAAGSAFLYTRFTPSGAINSIAVLPFDNMSGNDDADYLSDGITESLIDDLSTLPNLKVMSHNAVFRYKDKQVDARTAGRELGVRAVLTGHLTQHGNDLSIRAELVNVDDNSALWGDQYNRTLLDALAVQSDIARQIVEKLRLRLSNDQIDRMSKRQTVNPEAYQLYLKGRYYAAKFDSENLNRGREYIRQALALDPKFALGWDGLAYYYALIIDWFDPANEVGPKALEAAHKALELDPDLVEAHVELGSVHVYYTFDWMSAEKEFKRALQLNPDYAPAHEYYAWYLIAMGRNDEGLAEIRKAEQLDPLSSEIGFEYGLFLIYSRRYEDAVTQLTKTKQLDPDLWPIWYFLGQAQAHLGHSAEALAALARSQQTIGDNPSPPLAEEARVHALAGHRDESIQTLTRLLSLAKKTHVSKYVIATVYAVLDDKDQALTYLERAYDEHSFMLDFLKVDPELDSLRSEPRFEALLKKMNFPR